MEPTLTYDIDTAVRDRDDVIVHEWRAARLRALGVSAPLSEMYADLVDWRAVAALVDRGCPPPLALAIVR